MRREDPIVFNVAGGIVTAQSTAEYSLKMVVKMTETSMGFILTNKFLTFYWF
jgi:hypothetical protein